MISNIVTLQIGTNVSISIGNIHWNNISTHQDVCIKNAHRIRHSRSTLRIYLKGEKKMYSKIYA